MYCMAGNKSVLAPPWVAFPGGMAVIAMMLVCVSGSSGDDVSPMSSAQIAPTHIRHDTSTERTRRACEHGGGAQRGDVVVVGDGRAQPHVGGGGAEGGLVDACVVPE